MIIIRLKGGMGNQLFQYAFGLSLAKKLNTSLRLDLSSLLDRSKGNFVYRNYDLSIFNVKATFLTSPSVLEKVYRLKSSLITKMVRQSINKGRHFVKEVDFHYQQELVDQATTNSIYEGWFQSERYFDDVKGLLRKQFTFKAPLLPRSQSLFHYIQSSNSICLNVRRTDFLKVDNLNTTNKEYFLKAAEYLAQKIENPVFFIFSDDVKWCEENIVLNHPAKIVDHKHKGIKFGNYLQLMSHCKHFIIPNSSFAWWAVWMNQYEGKMVVAPKNWFNDPSIETNDLVPKNWIRL